MLISTIHIYREGTRYSDKYQTEFKKKNQEKSKNKIKESEGLMLFTE